MTVRNFRPAVGEKTQYITPDGVLYDLHNPPDRSVLLYEGDGLPQVTYSTTRGPFQHGDTVVEGRLQSRTIDMAIRQNGCDRNAYWALRQTIDGILRPNRTDLNNPSPGILRRVLSNGNIRDLSCYVTKGPLYKFPSNWDMFSFQETLRFTAYDPIFFEPVLRSASVSDFAPPPVVIDITFPFTFPFVFGSSVPVFTKSLMINYSGTWEEYPKIIITGPATNMKIVHQALGLILSFDGYTIDATTVVTIDLTYAKKTIMANDGTSWLGKLSNNSDLVAFRLETDPLVANGVNSFDVSCSFGTTATRVEFQYRNKYIGVS